MKYYDCSVTITPDLAVWPGDPAIILERVNKIEDGANANVSVLKCGVHVGTHLDAPFHFLEGGTTVETLPLEILIGDALVVELDGSVNVIDKKVVVECQLPKGTERLLFKTRNSTYWKNSSTFHSDFVGISKDGAEALVDMGVKLVGIDYLSIAPFKQSRPTHEVLLQAKMIVVEGLNLAEVNPGPYQLICLPLKLGGSDGAPSRVVLVEK